MQHLETLFDITPPDLHRIIATSAELKRRLAEGDRPPILQRQILALLFEKPSLRTRVSFEAGMAQLGGTSMFLGEDVGWGKRESFADFSRVLGQYVDAVVVRAKSHESVRRLASFNVVPVINGLTDLSHPCQAIADVMTIYETFGDLKGRHLVFVGDGNNVARSLMLICAMLEMRFTLACPEGYEIDATWQNRVRQRYPQSRSDRFNDPFDAVTDADVIYTDVWTSMGQEEESERRLRDFAGWTIDDGLVSLMSSRGIVLHCLPAHDGEEITASVLYGDRSAAWDQAENRLHAQKALLSLIVP